MASAQRGNQAPAFEIVVPARNEARRLPEGLAALRLKAATLPLPTAIVVVDSASSDGTSDVVRGCQRLGATLTEIPVHWRDVAGSTFSVQRHSVAVFRDVAAIWLRSTAARDREPRDAPVREPAAQQPLPAAQQPLPAGVGPG